MEKVVNKKSVFPKYFQISLNILFFHFKSLKTNNQMKKTRIVVDFFIELNKRYKQETFLKMIGRKSVCSLRGKQR